MNIMSIPCPRFQLLSLALSLAPSLCRNWLDELDLGLCLDLGL
jgi:hypothetical protein